MPPKALSDSRDIGNTVCERSVNTVFATSEFTLSQVPNAHSDVFQCLLHEPSLQLSFTVTLTFGFGVQTITCNLD